MKGDGEAHPAVLLRDEYGAEVFYNYPATPWFRVTADVQAVRPAQDRVNAVTGGLRGQIAFWIDAASESGHE